MAFSRSGIPYWYTKPDVVAKCETPGCDGWWADANAKGVAAKHAKDTGHVTSVQETRVFVYGEESPGVNPNSPYGSSK